MGKLDVLREHLEAEARHDASAAASTYVEDSFYENAALGLRFAGKAMVEFQYAASYGFIPDLEATVDFESVLDDAVVQVGRITGTPSDEFLGVPATGERIDLPYTAIISFEGGRMKGEHVYYDLEEFCSQAGLEVGLVREAAAKMRAPADA